MSNSSVDSFAVTRRVFLKQLVETKGFTYEQADKAYDCLVEVFANAVVSKQRINIGKVMSISPIKKNPRMIKMGFGGKTKVFHLSSRVKFHVNIYREFLNKHQLNWQL